MATTAFGQSFCELLFNDVAGNSFAESGDKMNAFISR